MKKWIIKIALFVIILVTAGTSMIYFFVDRELSKMYGGHTQVADFYVPNDAPSYFVLNHVNVLAPAADKFISDQTVIIDEGKIVSVGSTAETADDVLLANTRVIDGKGMYLVPGYTDSHVHLWESENDLLLYIANGVTQVRDMNALPATLKWKKAIAAGRPGPDLFAVAPQFATFGFIKGLLVGWTQHKTIVRSEEQVNLAVKSYYQNGYDAIKASSFLDKQGYVALSAATKGNAIPMVGHIPLAVGLDDLWHSNQIEVAHVEELMKALNREFGGYNSENADEFLEFVQRRSDDVANHLRDNNISVTSTLSLIDSLQTQKSKLDEVLGAAPLEYANPGISEGVVITSRGMGWLPEVNIYRWPGDWDKDRREKSLIYWNAYAKAQHIVFESLLNNNVAIMAGTDANVPVMVPGFSLLEEMKVLNDSGMTPAQVLASVTTVPALIMGTNTGKVRPGFKANLVLLRDNPLKDIGAVDSIEMVIKSGRVFTRSDLDMMLQAVETANSSSRTVPIDF